MTGAWAVLQKTRGINIGRIAGASAGAWCAIFIACNLPPIDWAQTYITTQRLYRDSDSELLECYREFAEQLLPADAHVRCSGRVFISLTVIEGGLLRNLVVSEFLSRRDLINTAIASSQLPFISTKGFGWRWRGRLVLDGGLTNNVPVFHDSLSGQRDQLVFHLSEVPYSMLMSLRPRDTCIESLVLRGAVEMKRLLTAGIQTNCIEFLPPTTDPHLRSTVGERLRLTFKWLFLIMLILPFYIMHKLYNVLRNFISPSSTVATRLTPPKPIAR